VPIKVLFDSAIAAQQEFGGVSKYYVEMAERLGAYDVEHRTYAPLFINHYLREKPGRTIGMGIKATRISRKAATLIGRHTLPIATALYRPDLIHQTLYDMSTAPKGNVPVVITIHDMIQELFPHDFPDGGWIERKRRAIGLASWILCDSRNTEIDLLRLYPQAEGRTSVVHLAAGASNISDASPISRPRNSDTGRPFLLYVGHRGGYKNYAGLLEAYARSPRLRQDLDLVCAGGGSFNPTEILALEKLNLTDRVRHVAVNDEALTELYGTAAIFVYPSLYEGFGLPPLEAMRAGCPVVALRAGSVPEICGDAARYAGSTEPDALGAAIQALWDAPTEREWLIDAGQVRSRDFSWEKCARETAKIYRHVVEMHRQNARR
jgi:glycosyltransferase involved in cell wall biosynthesis